MPLTDGGGSHSSLRCSSRQTGRARYLLLYLAGGFAAAAAQLYPHAKILTLLVVFPVRIRASVFLGLWFLYQLAEAHFGLTSAGTTSGGTAFFAHIGGFVFGVMAAVMLARTGQRKDTRAERSRFGFGGRPVTQNM